VPQNTTVNTVVDDGWLLHKVKWQQGGSYQDVIEQYVRYLRQHFGHHVVVVFDGYDSGATTKDYEHKRRAVKCAPDVAIDLSRPSYSDQTAFLANDSNKKQFVEKVMTHLQHVGLLVKQAASDADTLIVHTAIELATGGDTVTVVANDTRHPHHVAGTTTMHLCVILSCIWRQLSKHQFDGSVLAA